MLKKELKLPKYLSRKYMVVYYGSILIGLSIWFWFKYGLFGFIPPVTSIVIIAAVIGMWWLIKSDEVKNKVLGDGNSARELLIKTLGTIFTGFVLMITIIWGLIGRNLNLHDNIVYIQSFLLALLFFFIAASFYCILADLKK